jgi:hypothetical protein
MHVVVCEHYARRWENFKNSMNKFMKQKLKVLAAAMVERRIVCVCVCVCVLCVCVCVCVCVCGVCVCVCGVCVYVSWVSRCVRQVGETKGETKQTFLHVSVDVNEVLKRHMTHSGTQCELKYQLLS